MDPKRLSSVVLCWSSIDEILRSQQTTVVSFRWEPFQDDVNEKEKKAKQLNKTEMKKKWRQDELEAVAI